MIDNDQTCKWLGLVCVRQTHSKMKLKEYNEFAAGGGKFVLDRAHLSTFLKWILPKILDFPLPFSKFTVLIK